MFPNYSKKLFILSIVIVILNGIMFSLLSYPLDYKIILTLLLSTGENMTFWVIILVFVNLVLHFDRKRRGYKFKELGMASGLSFIPLLIYNILIPILNNLKSANNIMAWNITLVRYNSSTETSEILFFLSRIITIVCVFFFLFLVSYGVRDTFKLELIKAIYLSIFIVILAFLLSKWLFIVWEMVEF